MQVPTTYYLPILLLLSFGFQSCTPERIDPTTFSSASLLPWNEQIMEAAVAEDGLLTLKGVRSAAIMHVAIHNALNSIVPEYHTYYFETEQQDADPLAAAEQAITSRNDDSWDKVTTIPLL